MQYKEFYDFVVKVHSIAKIGLTFSKDPYALENYQELSELSKNMLETFMNIKFDCSIIETIEGEFWISKKGTPCFRPKVLGPDILIETSWGGCFESSRGTEFEEISKLNGCKYSKFAPSHGGGAGYCYYVFPRTYQKTIDIDEI
jgi:hypothetical protein